jgi:hypothetical protein
MSEPRKPSYRCDACSRQEDAVISEGVWNLPDGWYELEHRPPDAEDSDIGDLYHLCSRTCVQSMKVRVLDENWEGPIRLRRTGAGAELPGR